MVSFPPIPVYIINLDSRPDRWETIYRQCLKYGIKPIRISAVKANPGWHGAGLSHKKIAEIAKEKKHEWYLVLEDDAEFSQNDWDRFLKLLPYLWEHRNEWETFNGGFGEFWELNIINKEPLIYKCKAVTAHFYLITKSGMEKFSLWNINEQPIDNYAADKTIMIGTYPFIATQAISRTSLHDRPQGDDSAQIYITNGERRVKELIDEAMAKEAFKNYRYC